MMPCEEAVSIVAVVVAAAIFMKVAEWYLQMLRTRNTKINKLQVYFRIHMFLIYCYYTWLEFRVDVKM